MIFTCTMFTGHWPVGTAAVVSADNCMDAATMLEKELESRGLKQYVSHNDMIPMKDKSVIVLCDGNY